MNVQSARHFRDIPRALIPWLGVGLLLVCSGCMGNHFPYNEVKARGNIDSYRRQLEQSLLDRYNNTPKFAGQIARVELIIPDEPVQSVDKQEVQVEFDQLVYDRWGKRVPELEGEYFMVTFSTGSARLVQTEASLRIGLDKPGGYSERHLETGRPRSPAGALLPPRLPSTTAPQEPLVPVVPPAPEEGVRPHPVQDEPAPRRDMMQAMTGPAHPRIGSPAPLPRANVRQVPAQPIPLDPPAPELDF